MIGVDMTPRLKGEVVFVVTLDGREAYRSELLSKGMAPVKVDLPLGEVKRMALIVESAGIVVGDMADWADIDTPIPEPQLVITACHLNCSEVVSRQHILDRYGFGVKAEMSAVAEGRRSRTEVTADAQSRVAGTNMDRLGQNYKRFATARKCVEKSGAVPVCQICAFNVSKTGLFCPIAKFSILDDSAATCYTEGVLDILGEWRNGRRFGLKIRWPILAVRVRIPPRPPL